MAKAADLSKFQVNAEQGSAPMEAPPAGNRRERTKTTVPLITKGFRLKPEAARQFDILKTASCLNVLLFEYLKVYISRLWPFSSKRESGKRPLHKALIFGASNVG